MENLTDNYRTSWRFVSTSRARRRRRVFSLPFEVDEHLACLDKAFTALRAGVDLGVAVDAPGEATSLAEPQGQVGPDYNQAYLADCLPRLFGRHCKDECQ